MRLDMIANPRGQISFAHRSGGHVYHDADHLRLLCNESPAVEAKEDVHRLKSDAFVAVEKAMISAKAISVGSAKASEILPLIGKQIAWPRQGRFDESFVANAGPAAMLLDLVSMDRFHPCSTHPLRRIHGLQPLQDASSRIALRYALAPSS